MLIISQGNNVRLPGIPMHNFENGMETDTAVLSKMMGHTKERTTQNYFDIDLFEIVEGTKKANFAALGI